MGRGADGKKTGEAEGSSGALAISATRAEAYVIMPSVEIAEKALEANRCGVFTKVEA